MKTKKDVNEVGVALPQPCSADPHLEEICDKIRRGEPVGIVDACAAIEYHEKRKQQKPPSLWKRLIGLIKPNVNAELPPAQNPPVTEENRGG